ncbi:PREDICTED: putative malate dehydrogenase 1B [Nicrophorus vespilloides]|uniref:Malate dehydrogenase 1B n=1 Tax=Nicrophorus vespilloides TaxID=110193 RepID=A0ABM1M9X0_NICVS|nr:PREDICTED: putative malate dehydrogenase 1B [Nicrophorus vespilloides]
MVIFVIAGIASCKDYAHISYVCRYLEKKLPDFHINRQEFELNDWKVWLRKINRTSNWQHNSSPLVYKELLYYGGMRYYVGGISEFWEYCFDYYGLESYLSAEELADLAKDNYEVFVFMNFLAQKIDEIKGPDATTNITFYGYDDIVDVLVPELFKIEELTSKKPLRMNFYDNEDNDFAEALDFIKNDYNCSGCLVETIGDAIKDCDILFILENMTEMERHKPEVILIRINQLAETISRIGKRSIKVIFANYGPTCFAATLLSDSCHIRIPNIVVVASDIGLGVLSQISEECKISMDKLQGPPVWGYLDNNQFVDLEFCLKKCDVYKPFERAIRSTENSTLQMGTIATEMRFINYLIDDPDDICNSAFIRKESLFFKLDRPSIFAKVSATVNLLKIWYGNKYSNEVISLGVKSNESFKISRGLIFAQPAVLEKGTWTPYAKYPVRDQCQEIITRMVKAASNFVNNFYSRLPDRTAIEESC